MVCQTSVLFLLDLLCACRATHKSKVVLRTRSSTQLRALIFLKEWFATNLPDTTPIVFPDSITILETEFQSSLRIVYLQQQWSRYANEICLSVGHWFIVQHGCAPINHAISSPTFRWFEFRACTSPKKARLMLSMRFPDQYDPNHSTGVTVFPRWQETLNTKTG